MLKILGWLLLIPLLTSQSVSDPSDPVSTGEYPYRILGTISTSQDYVVAFRAQDDTFHLGFVEKTSTAQDVHYTDLVYTAFTGFRKIRDIQLLELQGDQFLVYWREWSLVYFQLFQNRSAVGEPQTVIDKTTRSFNTKAGGVTNYKNEKLIFAQISRRDSDIEYTYSVYDINGTALSRQVAMHSVDTRKHADPKKIELSVCGDNVLVAFKEDGMDYRNRQRVDNKINIVDLYDANMDLIKRVSVAQEESRDDVFTTCSQDQVFAVRKRNSKPFSYSVYDANTFELLGEHEITASQTGAKYDTEYIEVFSTDAYPLNVFAVPDGSAELYYVDESGDWNWTQYDQLYDFEFVPGSQGYAILKSAGNMKFSLELYSDELALVTQRTYGIAMLSTTFQKFASHMGDDKLQLAFLNESNVLQLAVIDTEAQEETEQISAMARVDQTVALIQASQIMALTTLDSVDLTTEESTSGYGLWTVLLTAVSVLGLAVFAVGYLNRRKGQHVLNVYKPLVTSQV